MNFIDLLNNGSPLDDLNEPPIPYDSEVSQYPSNCSNLKGTHNTEAHTDDQETQCEPISSKSQKYAQRSNNFSRREDELLISAWLNTSLDPIKGSDQKKIQFWKRITKYFQDNQSRTDQERTEKSLSNRWSKISFSVAKFTGHYAAVEHLRKSGHMEVDKIQDAKKLYKEKEGRSFVLDHCWTLLRFQQKWMGEQTKFQASRSAKACATKNQFSINLEDDYSNAPEPAPLKRPTGRKAAKEGNKKPRSNGQGDDNEKASSKIQSELEEFRARRLESDRLKADQLKLLLDIEQKKVALKEKEIEPQPRSEETKIMAMDTSLMQPI